MKAWLAEFLPHDRTVKWVGWGGCAAFLLSLFSGHRLAACFIGIPLVVYLMGVLYRAANQPWD